jgi:hypothetical protein
MPRLWNVRYAKLAAAKRGPYKHNQASGVSQAAIGVQMIGYLRSLDRFSDGLELGPEEHIIGPLHLPYDRGLPLIGIFAYLSELRILFYRWQEVLRLKWATTRPSH